MKIVFTTNKKFWSRTFRFLVKEPFSHVAFKFNFGEIELTIDCSTDGGRMMTWEKFQSIHAPLAEIDLKNDQNIERELFISAMTIVGKKYDMPAYVYAIWRGLLFRFFGIEAPKMNLLNSHDKYLCTEIFLPIAPQLSRYFGISFDGINIAIQTPYRLYKYIKGKLDGI